MSRNSSIYSFLLTFIDVDDKWLKIYLCEWILYIVVKAQIFARFNINASVYFENWFPRYTVLNVSCIRCKVRAASTRVSTTPGRARSFLLGAGRIHCLHFSARSKSRLVYRVCREHLAPRGENERERESYGYKRVTFDRAGDLSAPAMRDDSDRISPGSDNCERKETISREILPCRHLSSSFPSSFPFRSDGENLVFLLQSSTE